MATLRFDGIDDYLEGTGEGAMNSALTIAALIRPDVLNAHTYVYTRTSGAATSTAFQGNSAGRLQFYNAGPATFSDSTPLLAHSYWWLIAVTRAAAPSTPRFHLKNITLASAWVHENGSVAHASNPPSVAGGLVRIGRGSTANYLQGDVAVAAWWDGTALTDPQVESLAATLKTSDWNALTPSSLTELTSLTPVDLKGLMTWTRTGPLLTGPDPPGWTYGLATAPANTVAPAVTGTPAAGQTLTCSTGTWSGTPTAYAYQWKRAGTAITGATASTYVLVSADKAKSVKCTVTASNTAGSASADSNAVTVLPDVGDVLIRTSTGWIALT